MHKVFIDLGYGDAGKGISVARAVMNEPTAAVVKFAGGAQCAHNVVIGGRHHTFSQFGSGALFGAPTLLTDDFIVDIPALWLEADALGKLGVTDPMSKIVISEDALVITQAMIAANRRAENVRGAHRHGSTGRGIGMTVAYDVATGNGVRAKDLYDLNTLIHKIDMQRRWLLDEYNMGLQFPVRHEAEQIFAQSASITVMPEDYAIELFEAKHSSLFFEGSQGVLLDENIGFFPHVTRATTTSKNAERILRILGGEYKVYGVIRTYMTRHGAGPLPTEISSAIFDNDHNAWGLYQGAFRRGLFDYEAIAYALKHQRVDGLIVTHGDVTLPVAFGPKYEDWAYGDFADRMDHTERLMQLNLDSYDQAEIANPLGIARLYDLPLVQAGYGPSVYDYV
jgi:adenylosuccinate synthase